MITIYALTDPATAMPRYVGSTSSTLVARLREHVRVARKQDHPRARWIRELASRGERPGIVALATVADEERRPAECMWLARLAETHNDLLNAVSARCGGTRSHIPWLTVERLALLGKVSDAVIAEGAGVTRKAVSHQRLRLGIAASFDRSRNVPPPAMAGHNRIPFPAEMVPRLGMEPDHILAKEAGVPKRSVGRERQRRGIPPYATQTGNTGRFQKGHYPDRWRKRMSGE